MSTYNERKANILKGHLIALEWTYGVESTLDVYYTGGYNGLPLEKHIELKINGKTKTFHKWPDIENFANGLEFALKMKGGN
jgi:hypothetical protein